MIRAAWMTMKVTAEPALEVTKSAAESDEAHLLLHLRTPNSRPVLQVLSDMVEQIPLSLLDMA